MNGFERALSYIVAKWVNIGRTYVAEWKEGSIRIRIIILILAIITLPVDIPLTIFGACVSFGSQHIYDDLMNSIEQRYGH